MKKITIIIGHGTNDPGATNGKHNEFNYNSELAKMLFDELSKEYEVTTYNRGILKAENLNILNSYKSDLILSLHLNSAGKTTTGTEALYWYSSPKSKKAAEIISLNISNVLGLRNRGSKPRVTQDIKNKNVEKFKNMETRGSYILKGTNAPCVIVESFFISNDNDLRIGISKKEDISKAIKKSIKEYFKEMV